MTESSPVVRIARSYDPSRGLMVARGDFRSIAQGYSEHCERWEIPLDGLTFTMMRQGLAAVALHLAFRPLDESVGITVNVAKPALNLFLSGDAGRATVTGRAFVDGVRTGETGRLFVQTHRARSGVTESAIEIVGLDVLDIFEQYYARSIQSPARFFELDGDRFAAVMAMPDADREFLNALTRESLEAWADGGLATLDERDYRLYCGCTPERILGTVRALFADDPEALFQGEPAVEALCPRCGVRWEVTREQFAAATPEPPPAGS